ncbi:oxysterol-binding protein 1-like isoform X2 [Diadema antillarum]|uniref:oxysterol-binding protein 1-like n=1 Tax=Diadema antillarum TaxID=105358 RepID=UPI003A847F74
MAAENKVGAPENFRGWLYKWTNYIKGYQRRWFVLSNGLLSYYRNQAEMSHTCRGTINLAGAYIDTEDSCNFVISSGAQTFHLKAASEVERQRWVTALELAKAKAIQMMEEDSDDDEEVLPPETDRNEVQTTLRQLTSKLEDLNTCNDLIGKHGAALQRALSELEVTEEPAQATSRLKGISERATLFRITSNAMINACADFLELAQTHGRKWQKAIHYEQTQRLRLEETIETLAKQHNSLEQACREANSQDKPKSNSEVRKDEHSDDEDNEFFDAVDKLEFTTTVKLPRDNLSKHRRTASGGSVASTDSIGVIGRSGEDPEASSEEEMQPEAMVKVHTADDGNDLPNRWPRPKAPQTARQRRKKIPEKPNQSLSLWSIIKNCIGKELSRIPMPVNFNEPLSMLQRLTEDMLYSDLLNMAAQCDDTCEEMAYVAAFIVSAYAETSVRSTKPFNPLLGETFECDRTDDLGWRAISEQVSHHPPAAAFHVESKDWTLWMETTISSKFRGKYLQIFPQGTAHISFKKSGSHYTYTRVTVTVHNIIVGKLWVDQSGECELFNHTTKDVCRLNFKQTSYFSRDIPRKVTGVIMDSNNMAKFVLSGTWDKKMEYAKVLHITTDKSGPGKPVYERGQPKVLWQRNPPMQNTELMYNFNELAVTMNEPEDGVAPTDSRHRPDQRLMEDGFWDEANQEKLRLEEKQRAKRKKREAEAAAAAEAGKPYEGYRPVWFERRMDPITKGMAYTYRGDYWQNKAKQDWNQCPDIY